MEVASVGEGDKRRTDRQSFTSVHRSVPTTDTHQDRSCARQSEGTLLFWPWEAILLTSVEPVHWSVPEGRLLAHLTPNRYTVYTIHIKKFHRDILPPSLLLRRLATGNSLMTCFPYSLFFMLWPVCVYSCVRICAETSGRCFSRVWGGLDATLVFWPVARWVRVNVHIWRALWNLQESIDLNVNIQQFICLYFCAYVFVLFNVSGNTVQKDHIQKH